MLVILKRGKKVKTTGRILEVPVGEGLKGQGNRRFRRPIDGKGEVKGDGYSPIEVVAPGVIDRQSVDQPVQTGLKSIDVMVPIGRGQRNLLLVIDRQEKPPLQLTQLLTKKTLT